jgi:hypothetical protein
MVMGKIVKYTMTVATCVNNIARDGVSHATLTYNRLFRRKTVLPFLPRSRW